MSTNPSTRSDAQANRHRLVDAARSVFRERGAAADIKEIAERAGVGVGTVYRNFATKDDLLAAIVQSVMAEVRDLLAPSFDVNDPVASISAMLRLALAYAESEGPLLLALREVSHDGEFEGDPRALLRDALAAGVARGQFRRDIRIEILTAFMESHFPLYLDLRSSFSGEEASEAVVALVLSAISFPVGEHPST
ncbi:MAG: helix-turn-helix domain-containing protein [Dehalococcoidia bacterium]|nr:TetR/AcrR family transcriptional regulator [Dehalococcoidia bacterium]MCB9484961.1 TetR/AcrR family transcriptional regulator [Thermoflexaceae bacterium]